MTIKTFERFSLRKAIPIFLGIALLMGSSVVLAEGESLATPSLTGPDGPPIIPPPPPIPEEQLTLMGRRDLQGKLLVSNIAVASNEDGRLEAFAMGLDGTLYHRRQTAPNGGWRDQVSVLSIPSGIELPGFVRNIFGIDGTEMPRWDPLGGTGTLAVFGITPASPPVANPTVAKNADGRLEVFTRGLNGSVWHQWQNKPNGPDLCALGWCIAGWSGWYELGNLDTHWNPTNPIVSDIVAAKNADGRLEIFAVTSSGELIHRSQLAPNGGWSNWEFLGTPNDWGVSFGSRTGQIAVGKNQDGRLEVFAIVQEFRLDAAEYPRHVYHAWQGTPGGGYSGWAELYGIRQPSTLAVANNKDGRLELFATGDDKLVHHIWQEQPNSAWGGWYDLGPLAENDYIYGAITVAANPDGRLEIFGKTKHNIPYHNWQVAPNSGWRGWALLDDNTVASDLSVGMNQDGTFAVFGRGGYAVDLNARANELGEEAMQELGKAFVDLLHGNPVPITLFATTTYPIELARFGLDVYHAVGSIKASMNAWVIRGNTSHWDQWPGNWDPRFSINDQVFPEVNGDNRILAKFPFQNETFKIRAADPIILKGFGLPDTPYYFVSLEPSDRFGNSLGQYNYLAGFDLDKSYLFGTLANFDLRAFAEYNGINLEPGNFYKIRVRWGVGAWGNTLRETTRLLEVLP